MKAVQVGSDRELVLAEVAEPAPQRGEALIKVAAISLNRGEVRRAGASAEGHRPGWDFAGTVEQAAADGSGPKAGTRVVGLMSTAGWAEQLAVRTDMLATLPDAVSFAEASCLPVAGLTALYGLSRRGDLLARKVLVTGPTGGVGHFATQLAKLAGAQVVAAVRTPEQEAFVRDHGAEIAVVTGDDPESAKAHGPYDLVMESIGGASLTASARMLAPEGVCVVFGVSAGTDAKIDISPFYFAGGATLYGFGLFHELARRERASVGLARLAGLMAEKKLKTHIAVERPWTSIDETARELMARRFIGKAVLHLD
jgi:NADPH:quinone reductase